MAFLTNEKLTIVGAAGMIGSNMAQTALMMGLTSNLCLYDVFSPEGVAEEMRQCGFDGVNITATTDVKEAFTDAKYIISSGGAPRKAGMTREDLLKGNCEIAEQLGKDIKTYCPDVKHVVIIFNPADLTGLVTLLYSGLKPSQVTTARGARLDAFAECAGQEVRRDAEPDHGLRHLWRPRRADGRVRQRREGCRQAAERDYRYGGVPRRGVEADAAGRDEGRCQDHRTARPFVVPEPVLPLGRDDPFGHGGEAFRWPAGTFVNNEKYKCIMMAMKTTLDATGCHFEVPTGTADEVASLDASYEHLCKMRDELVTLNIVPPVSEWSKINPNL